MSITTRFGSTVRIVGPNRAYSYQAGSLIVERLADGKPIVAFPGDLRGDNQSDVQEIADAFEQAEKV